MNLRFGTTLYIGKHLKKIFNQIYLFIQIYFGKNLFEFLLFNYLVYYLIGQNIIPATSVSQLPKPTELLAIQR